MPKNINEPAAAVSLIEEFGLKGQVKFDLDERIVPVAVVADLVTKENRGRYGVGTVNQNPVAGEFAFHLLQVAPGTRVQVHGVRSQPGALSVVDFRVVDVTDLATLVAAAVTTTPFVNLNTPLPGTAGGMAIAPPVLAANMIGGTNVAILGTQFMLPLIEVGNPEILFDDLIIQAGSTPAALVIWEFFVNTGSTVNMKITEFDA